MDRVQDLFGGIENKNGAQVEPQLSLVMCASTKLEAVSGVASTDFFPQVGLRRDRSASGWQAPDDTYAFASNVAFAESGQYQADLHKPLPFNGRGY